MSYVTDYVMKKYQCKRGDFLLFKTTLYKLKIKNLITLFVKRYILIIINVISVEECKPRRVRKSLQLKELQRKQEDGSIG